MAIVYAPLLPSERFNPPERFFKHFSFHRPGPRLPRFEECAGMWDFRRGLAIALEEWDLLCLDSLAGLTWLHEKDDDPSRWAANGGVPQFPDPSIRAWESAADAECDPSCEVLQAWRECEAVSDAAVKRALKTTGRSIDDLQTAHRYWQQHLTLDGMRDRGLATYEAAEEEILCRDVEGCEVLLLGSAREAGFRILVKHVLAERLRVGSIRDAAEWLALIGGPLRSAFISGYNADAPWFSDEDTVRLAIPALRDGYAAVFLQEGVADFSWRFVDWYKPPALDALDSSCWERFWNRLLPANGGTIRGDGDIDAEQRTVIRGVAHKTVGMMAAIGVEVPSHVPQFDDWEPAEAWIRRYIEDAYLQHVAPGAAQPAVREIVHSPDYATVEWGTRKFLFTSTQAACAKVLIEAWKSGKPEVRGAAILEAAESLSDRLSTVFRDRSGAHPAWGTMIVQVKRGFYRIANP